MRILLKALFRLGNTHLPQQFQCPFFGLRFVHAFVQSQPFSQLTPYCEHRVQRCHRLLKDHPDLVAADRTHQFLPCIGQIKIFAIAAIKNEAAIRNFAATKFNKPHQRQRRDRFTRP